MQFEPYGRVAAGWPDAGRHILATFTDDSVVVYQAYRQSIGRFAADHGRFGGPDFSFGRMSWIKPNFLWMMYRSGWGTKPDQEVTLAVHLRRDAFDTILAGAVASSFGASGVATQAAWQEAVASSDVRLQWDPDHAPSGAPLARRAIQLGLRGEVLRRYASEWIVRIEDISERVAEERSRVSDLDALHVPAERVYPVRESAVAARLGLAL